MSKIETLRAKLAEAEVAFNKANEEVEHYRKLRVNYEQKIQTEMLKDSFDKNRQLLGKYWKYLATEENFSYSLFVKVKDITLNEYGEACFICESIEICKGIPSGSIKWYFYSNIIEYTESNPVNHIFSFEPRELIEISEEEFLSHKKV